MPPPTHLPVATKLLGLFVRGFWRRLAEWLPWWRPPQATGDPVEDFLRGIFEVIAKVEEQVRNGTYQPPEEKPRPTRKRDKKPPDKPPETAGRQRSPIPEPPMVDRTSDPPAIGARPAGPEPPPEPPPEVAAPEPRAAPPPTPPPSRPRPRDTSSRAAGRQRPRPVLRRRRSISARPERMPWRGLIIT